MNVFLIISAIIAVAGAMFSAYGAIQQGQAASDVAKYNAEVAEQEAQAARNKAAYEEGLYRDNAEKLKARQRMSFLASGVDISEGTPLLSLGESAANIEMDAMAIRYGGEAEAIKAKQAAQLYGMKGKQAVQASYFQAGSSLMTGAAQATGSLSRVKW